MSELGPTLALDLQPLDCRSDVNIFRVEVEGVRGVSLLPISLLIFTTVLTYICRYVTRPEIPQNPSAACLSPLNIEQQLSAPPNEKNIDPLTLLQDLFATYRCPACLCNYGDGVILRADPRTLPFAPRACDW